MSKEDLEALVETKKGELEDIQMPANQEAMPGYHSSRKAIYNELARLYDALGLPDAKELAEASARSEDKLSAAWSKSLNQAAGLNNGSNLEGGQRRKRTVRGNSSLTAIPPRASALGGTRKHRKLNKKRKYSRRR